MLRLIGAEIAAAVLATAADTVILERVPPSNRPQWLEAAPDAPATLGRIEQPAGFHQTDVPSLLRAAEALRARGEFSGAAEALNRAVEISPDDVRSRKARGAFFLNRADFEAARADLEWAAQLDPQDAGVTRLLGSLAFAEERYEEAVIRFTALTLEPDRRAWTFSSRAATYERLGQTDRALADHRAAAAIDPDRFRYDEWRLRLGRDRETVLREVEARLAEVPTDSSALAMRIRIAREDGRPAEALTAMDAAVMADPADDYLRTQRAGVRGLVGDLTGAEADLATVRAKTPDAEMLNSMCWSQAEHGFALDQALADCDAALTIAPFQAKIHDSRAMTLLHLGRLDEALEAYNRALELAPRLAASLYGRGLTLQALGEPGAQADIDRALTVSRQAAEPFAVYLARRGTESSSAVIASPQAHAYIRRDDSS